MNCPSPSESSSNHAAKLAQQFLPVVDAIVRQYKVKIPQHIQFEELRAAGLCGLAEVLHKNSDVREVTPSLKAHVSVRVRGAIVDALRREDPLSRRARGRVRSIAELSDEEAADSLGVSEERVQTIRKEEVHLFSLEDEDIGEPGTELAIEEALDSLDQQHWLYNKVIFSGLLTDNEQHTFVSMFQGDTQKEIAARLGVSEPRVSQLLTSAKNKLRQAVNDSCWAQTVAA